MGFHVVLIASFELVCEVGVERQRPRLFEDAKAVSTLLPSASARVLKSFLNCVEASSVNMAINF